LKKAVCPICGSPDCVDSSHLNKNLPKTECQRCGCKAPVGLVRERDSEVAIVDWRCRCCGFKWSSICPLPEGVGVGVAFWSVYEGCERCEFARMRLE